MVQDILVLVAHDVHMGHASAFRVVVDSKAYALRFVSFLVFVCFWVIFTELNVGCVHLIEVLQIVETDLEYTIEDHQ